MTDWAEERETVLRTFHDMLAEVTGDGSKKRQAGTKPPWWKDEAHLPAVFSHLNAYFHGEKRDKDSGVHPLIHAGWRCLAIAYRETYGSVDPAKKESK